MGTAAAIVGAGAVGAVGQAIAGRSVARAQGRAAEAQLAEARSAREAALRAAEPSPEELAQLNRAVELNEQDVVRKERLIEAADPAVIESGRQALQLLRGEEARTLDPVRRSRQEQRQVLQDRLRARLGPGFETSTAGIQALNRFDQETDSLLAQEQDRSLGRLLGVAERTTQQQGLAGSVGRAGTLAGLFGAPAGRRVAAITGTPITPFAGAPFVGQAQRAIGTQNLIGNLTGAVTSGLTLGALLGQRSPGLGAAAPPTQVGGVPDLFAGGRTGTLA